MTVRAIVGRALADDAGLALLGLLPAGIVAGNADSVQLRPFLVLSWQSHSPGFRGHARGPWILDLRCHDVPDDYDRLDAVLRRARTVLLGLADVVDEDSGERVTEVHWTGTGGDLRDTDRGTILRVSTFTVVGG